MDIIILVMLVLIILYISGKPSDDSYDEQLYDFHAREVEFYKKRQEFAQALGIDLDKEKEQYERENNI